MTIKARHAALLMSMDMGATIVSINWKAHALSLDEASPLDTGIVIIDGLPVHSPIDAPPDKRVIKDGWVLVEEGLVDHYGLVTRKGRDAALAFAKEFRP